MTDLSDAKRHLLEQRLGARPAAPTRAEDSIPIRPPGPVPLSAGQSALLYEYRMRPDEAVYNIVHAYRIRGDLDTGRLRSAFLAAVGRHEPLTTAFDPERTPLEPRDALQFRGIETDDDGFEQLARSEARHRFDLDCGPLVRVTMVSLGENDHGLVLALHHVSSDAASLANLWRDVDRAYRGEDLPEPARSYSDHAHWQAARINDADREFWARHLGPDPHAVELPLANPGADEPDGYLTRPTSIEVSRLRSAGHRPTSFFLATFAALLQRYTDSDDVVVGVVASTRDHPVVDSLVGYFLTILPLRLDVDPRSTPAEMATSTDQTLAEALAHRHVPYAEITADLRRRGVARPDPARVMFVLDEPQRPELADCTVDGHLVHPGASVTDLTVFVRPSGAFYETSLEWSGLVYRRTDIEALADEYARMLEWGLDHPEEPWSDLPVEGARGDAIGPPLTPRPRPLPVLIDEHATDRPDAPAVRCGTDGLSYHELVTRAAAAAEALEARGVVAGDRVGVLLPRSVDLVATILAIQRLGAAYVPIDVSYPEQRVGLLLRLTSPRLTITDEAGADRIDGPVVTSAELARSSAPRPEHPAGAAVRLDDPAYVIFTSGSTGRPRGVLVDHRRLAASTSARLDHYADASGRPLPVDRFLMVSSVGFDSSVAGIYWTLVSGGELVLPTEHEVHDVDALAALIDTASVTHTLMVPTLYRALLERNPEALSSLRTVVVAGEVCPATLVELHHRHLPDTELWNEYGPTETTVWATAHRCRPGDEPVPIGGPVPGATTRVVDRWLRPRPLGAAGELAIGGAGVTDGYIDDPQTTAARFISDPGTDGRWYLTGDLVRADGAGRLIFLGRRDHQLSVGGVRVEPEEIEVALTACEGVRAAVVRTERRLMGDPLDALAALPTDLVARILAAAGAADDPAAELASQLARHVPGPDMLVAYVEGDELDIAALESHLRESFPPALVPTAIEATDRLPRTEHGKIDRSALPPPLRRVPQTGAGPEPTGLLGELVSGWNRVLGTTELGPDSDFFGSGGNSLLAIELVTSLEARLGRQVPISSLVLGRTPRRLAELVARTDPSVPAPAPVRKSYVVPLRPEGELPPLVIAPTAGGNLIKFDPFVQVFDERFSIIGLELPGADRDEDLPPSIDDLCDAYVRQLREALPHGPYRFLGWSFGGVVALELARRLRDEGETVDLVGMIDTLVPGMQRARRSRIYAEMARRGDVMGILRRIRDVVRWRISLKSTARLGRRAARDGKKLDPAARGAWVTLRVDEIVERHRPAPYGGRVVYFSAADSYSWRTTEPWQEFIDDLEIVSIEGSHAGDEGLMTGARIATIADEMARRLV